ncbi:hypothetical protein [Aquimarina litoralis]|uniref:hypothetical protein n=1 Tax=Aquimarina litoralis TaxID=584605 RepID=UPI001C57FB33|nr:hypothetical protein [Aquimarina litoralis]MBW1299019.1 hypothetical protein [Aquimarina litoralis]
MDKEKEKWMEDILQSMNSSKRAAPRPELFQKIKNEFTNQKVAFITLTQWKLAIAAAIVVLCMNSTAIYYIAYKQPDDKNVTFSDTYNKALIESYQIY